MLDTSLVLGSRELVHLCQIAKLSQYGSDDRQAPKEPHYQLTINSRGPSEYQHRGPDDMGHTHVHTHMQRKTQAIYWSV